MKSEITIVIPNKGRVDLLSQALESLRTQRFDGWECIVVDDGSRTEEIAEVRGLMESDSRFRLILRDTEPRGADHCRNIGLAAASAPLIVFLDSDDMLSPDCTGMRVEAMRANPDLDFGLFRHQHFFEKPGDRDDVWQIDPNEDHLDRFLRVSVPFQTAGPTWRREALDVVGPWDESLPSRQDWDFHVRALIAGLKYRYFDQPLFWHRLTGPHRDSITAKRTGPEHNHAEERVIQKAARLLETAGRLTEVRKRYIARNHLIIAERWIAAGAPEQAARVWGEARDLGLIDGLTYREGSALLSVYSDPAIRRALRLYLKVRWPAEMQHSMRKFR